MRFCISFFSSFSVSSNKLKFLRLCSDISAHSPVAGIDEDTRVMRRRSGDGIGSACGSFMLSSKLGLAAPLAAVGDATADGAVPDSDCEAPNADCADLGAVGGFCMNTKNITNAHSSEYDIIDRTSTMNGVARKANAHARPTHLFAIFLLEFSHEVILELLALLDGDEALATLLGQLQSFTRM